MAITIDRIHIDVNKRFLDTLDTRNEVIGRSHQI